jgi:hypothetical protein
MALTCNTRAEPIPVGITASIAYMDEVAIVVIAHPRIRRFVDDTGSSLPDNA